MRTILNNARTVCVGACVLAVASCGSSTKTATTTYGTAGTCPASPVSVVVTVDQWGDIVNRLAGACGRVTTIFKSSSADPHEYEPTPADAAAFEDATLVVMNGLDYDPWAEKAVDALDDAPVVVNAGDIVGRAGDNPHLWYGPDYVFTVADAVTAALTRIEPRATAYFAQSNRAWQASMRPYRTEIERIRPRAAGKSYGATEGIFDYMGTALGMRNVTPAGYARAAANETEPGPGDLHAFEQALEDRTMSVLILNTQTEGAITDHLRDAAEAARIPVVEVTESVPPSFDSFESWQLHQLRDLGAGLPQ